MVGCVDDPGDDVAVLARPVGAENCDRHHAHARVTDAGDAYAIVRRGVDDAGHPGAVTVRVGRSVRGVENRRAGNELAGEVRMRGIHAGVEHGDGRRADGNDAVVSLVPADAGQRPLVRVLRVAGERLDVANDVGFDADDVGARGQRCDGAVGRVDRVHVQRRNCRDVGRAGCGDVGRLVGCGRSGSEADDVARCRRRRLGRRARRRDPHHAQQASPNDHPSRAQKESPQNVPHALPAL